MALPMPPIAGDPMKCLRFTGLKARQSEISKQKRKSRQKNDRVYFFLNEIFFNFIFCKLLQFNYFYYFKSG